MRTFLQKYEVFVFLFGIVVVNALFVTACVKGVLPDGAYGYGRFALLGATLVLVVFLSRGTGAVVDLFRPLTRWRVSPGWYVFSLIWAAAICAVVLLGKVALTQTTFDDLSLRLGIVTSPRIVLNIFIGALVGEIVWVSYSVGALSKRHTVIIASAIVGLFWTAWWMPMSYYDYGIVPGLHPLALLISQTGVALMCGFVYFHTRSAICVLLLQIGVSASILILPVLPTTGGQMTYVAFGITYAVATVLAYLLAGPRPLIGQRIAQPAI
ncbi:hypothetical protein ACXYMO_11620 [Arenibacterium sp. CAU 1754]